MRVWVLGPPGSVSKCAKGQVDVWRGGPVEQRLKGQNGKVRGW